MSVAQVGSQLTITFDATFLGETLQLPAVTGTINATGFFAATGGGSVIKRQYGRVRHVQHDQLHADVFREHGTHRRNNDNPALRRCVGVGNFVSIEMRTSPRTQDGRTANRNDHPHRKGKPQ